MTITTSYITTSYFETCGNNITVRFPTELPLLIGVLRTDIFSTTAVFFFFLKQASKKTSSGLVLRCEKKMKYT